MNASIAHKTRLTEYGAQWMLCYPTVDAGILHRHGNVFPDKEGLFAFVLSPLAIPSKGFHFSLFRGLF